MLETLEILKILDYTERKRETRDTGGYRMDSKDIGGYWGM